MRAFRHARIAASRHQQPKCLIRYTATPAECVTERSIDGCRAKPTRRGMVSDEGRPREAVMHAAVVTSFDAHRDTSNVPVPRLAAGTKSSGTR